VLWLSPWLRPFARIYSELLIEAGAEVLLVTTARHPSSDAARRYELVLDDRPKTAHTWPEFARARRAARRFAPDVVVAEFVRDPRWMLFAPGVPRITLIHDDRPHDAVELKPRWERTLFGWWTRRSAATVAFSEYVAGEVRASASIPLTSDLAEAEVPPFVGPEQRRDFVLVGRLNDYKNVGVCLQAWEKHTSGTGWQGDKLILIGDGDHSGAFPEHVEWQSGEYQYSDVLPVLARAKGSVVHYRRATQSGVQVLAMQLGVTPIVSTQGALPEFQPAGEVPVGVDDVDALAAAFDSLAAPGEAATRGARARAHFEAGYSGAVSAAALRAVIRSVVGDSES
jgi:glycosyltransferase involved in cell wall biosynthesis